MLVVSDTSPLRGLQALGLVSMLPGLYGRVLVPPAVARELAVDAPGVGVFPLSDYPFLVVRAPTDLEAVSRLRTELDDGESEALALAIEVRADRVLIDESDGRRVAGSLGLKTVGVLALLVEAKSRGMVERVGPLMDLLDQRIHFRISRELRQRVLEDAGEVD